MRLKKMNKKKTQNKINNYKKYTKFDIKKNKIKCWKG